MSMNLSEWAGYPPIDALRTKLAERDAEIERLRGLLGDVQIILDSHNNIVGNLNAEIERLRQMLKDAGVLEWVIDRRG